MILSLSYTLIQANNSDSPSTLEGNLNFKKKIKHLIRYEMNQSVDYHSIIN